MCPACATPPSANSPGVARREPSFRTARLLDCARLRPLRARRVATPAGYAERDQVRLPNAGQGTEPDFGKADRRQTCPARTAGRRARSNILVAPPPAQRRVRGAWCCGAIVAHAEHMKVEKPRGDSWKHRRHEAGTLSLAKTRTRRLNPRKCPIGGADHGCKSRYAADHRVARATDLNMSACRSRSRRKTVARAPIAL